MIGKYLPVHYSYEPQSIEAESLNQVPGITAMDFAILSILLDIMMPQMNGFEVCRSLKQDKTTAGIPVIFISALKDYS